MTYLLSITADPMAIMAYADQLEEEGHFADSAKWRIVADMADQILAMRGRKSDFLRIKRSCTMIQVYKGTDDKPSSVYFLFANRKQPRITITSALLAMFRVNMDAHTWQEAVRVLYSAL